MEIFAKVLTITDIKRRLSFSDHGCVHSLPRFQGCHVIVLQVEDDAGISWNFGCMIRSGVIPKLVIVSGWIQFVRHKGLREGDIVKLYKEEEDVIAGAEYKIKVKKSHTSVSGPVNNKRV
ncbi:hypothetical protein PTKIN_Ptkin10aG0140000 [Pterospermum kingtungense]